MALNMPTKTLILATLSTDFAAPPSPMSLTFTEPVPLCFFHAGSKVVAPSSPRHKLDEESLLGAFWIPNRVVEVKCLESAHRSDITQPYWERVPLMNTH